MSYPNPYLRQYGYGNQYAPAYQQYQQPVHGFVYVSGLDGANAYQMPPNSEMPLFDSTTENRIFIKTTDSAGYPTIRAVRCVPEDLTPQASADHASASDIESLRAEIEELRSLIYAKHVSAPADGRPDADAVGDQADGRG